MDRRTQCAADQCDRLAVKRRLCNRCYLASVRAGTILPDRRPINQTITRLTDEIAGIDLGGGIWALIDTVDIDTVKSYKWRLCKSPGNTTVRSTGHMHATMYLHRLIMRTTQPDVVTHLNRDRLDNRRSNLHVLSGRGKW